MLTVKSGKILSLSDLADDIAEGKERSIQRLKQALGIPEGEFAAHEPNKDPTGS